MRGSRGGWSALLAAVLLVGLAAWCTAAGAQALRVAVDASNPPFMFERDGHADGLYPALLAAVFREMDVAAEIEARPWPRAINEIDAGRAGVAGIYKNTERLQKYDYSEPLFVERVNVYVRAGGRAATAVRTPDALAAPTGESVASRPPRVALASLNGLRIGVIRGWSYGDAFDAARRSGAMAVEDVASDEQNLRKLEAGRLDAMLAIDDALRARLAAHPQVQLAGTLIENPTFLAFNKSAGMTGFLDRFNAALARLRQRGEVERIVAQALSER